VYSSAFFLVHPCTCGSWNMYTIGWLNRGTAVLVSCNDCSRTAVLQAILIGESAEKARGLHRAKEE
jgi:hypothetical protein